MYEGIAEHIYPWLEGKWAPPFRIHILPTNRCNLQCRSCWRWKMQADKNDWLIDKLPDERLLNIVEEGANLGVKEWEFSGGGEPLVRKKIVLKMMEKIKKFGMRGDMTTNGTLFTPQIVEFMVRIGWDHIIFSLDGPNPEINDYLRPPSGTFQKIISALKLFRRYKGLYNSEKPKISIASVLSKININSIIPMIELAGNYGTEGIIFEPVKYFSKRCSELMLEEEDYGKIKSQAEIAVRIAEEKGIYTNVDWLIDYPSVLKDFGKSSEHLSSLKSKTGENRFFQVPCYEPWYRMLIGTTGDVTPCCMAEWEPNLENILDHSLIDIWLGEYYENFRQRILNNNLPKFCSQCNAGIILHSESTIRTKLLKIWNEQDKGKGATITKIDVGLGTELNLCLVSREYPLETGWGGIGKYTYLTATGLAKKGHNVHVIAQTFRDEEHDYIEDSVHVHRIKHPEIFKARRPLEELARRLEYSWRVYRKILELIDKYGIQVVEGPNFSAECFVYSLFKKTPLITRIHTPYEEIIRNFGWELNWDRKISCFLEDELIRKSDLVTCSTQIYADLIKSEKQILPEKLRVIPLGIEISRLSSLEVSYETNPRPLNVLFVGRLEKRKGIHILFQAIPLVIEKLRDVEFTIVGRDTFFQQDEASFRSPEGKSFKSEFYDNLSEDIKKKVYLVGEVGEGELRKYYGNTDLFVAPSLHETFGYVYLEAMSWGKPVVGCKVGGVPEVIRDGEVGLLVEPGNHQELAQAIIKILKDSKLRFEMGINARRYVYERFSLENLVEMTEKVYLSILKQGR